jgi:hypothetical protein
LGYSLFFALFLRKDMNLSHGPCERAGPATKARSYRLSFNT